MCPGEKSTRLAGQLDRTRGGANARDEQNQLIQQHFENQLPLASEEVEEAVQQRNLPQ